METLVVTNIVLTVNSVRRTSKKADTIQLARSLVKRWKVCRLYDGKEFI